LASDRPSVTTSAPPLPQFLPDDDEKTYVDDVDRDSKDAVHLPIALPIVAKPLTLSLLPSAAPAGEATRTLTSYSKPPARKLRATQLAIVSFVIGLGVAAAWAFLPLQIGRDAAASAKHEPKALDLVELDNALNSAAREAARCGTATGPRGPARVAIELLPSGNVPNVTVVSAGFAGTEVAACITSAMRKISIGKYVGDPVKIDQTVVIE
jgi:hypothetical protein